MKYVRFVARHLGKSWFRTLSTVAAMAVCIFLFCTLRTFVAAVSWGLKTAKASRLVTHHSLSLIYRLPESYRSRIAAVPGVKAVAVRSFFGGVYRDPKNFFTNVSIEAEPYLAMYPEFLVSPEQKRDFLADMRGCLIGPGLARKFGWKVGDTFQMESFIPYYRIGEPFEFVVRGIYETDEARYPGTNDSVMFFHQKYLETMIREKIHDRAGVGQYVVEIADPTQAGVVSKRIDALFNDSDHQTRTETEAAFRAGLVSLSGHLVALLNTIGLAVTFAILLVTANTMSMAVRERRKEIAVLKTLGFSSARVMALILGEGALLGALGGAVGLLLGRATIRMLPRLPFIGDAVRGFPNLGLTAAVGSTGFALALLLGVAAGLLPALFAYRARITDMLREV